MEDPRIRAAWKSYRESTFQQRELKRVTRRVRWGLYVAPEENQHDPLARRLRHKFLVPQSVILVHTRIHKFQNPPGFFSAGIVHVVMPDPNSN